MVAVAAASWAPDWWKGWCWGRWWWWWCCCVCCLEVWLIASNQHHTAHRIAGRRKHWVLDFGSRRKSNCNCRKRGFVSEEDCGGLRAVGQCGFYSIALQEQPSGYPTPVVSLLVKGHISAGGCFFRIDPGLFLLTVEYPHFSIQMQSSQSRCALLFKFTLTWSAFVSLRWFYLFNCAE